MVKNKEIQESRMKSYFIQATKELIKAEGLKCVSVRSIADKAGYSYATLYHYFKDVNELIFLCVHDFQEECKQFVADQTRQKPERFERMKAILMAYISYFVEYPAIFELFYLAPVGDFGNKQNIIDVIYHSLDEICDEEWTYCVSHNLLSAERKETLKDQLKYTVIGLLLFYIHRHSPYTYTEFMNQAQIQIDHIMA